MTETTRAVEELPTIWEISDDLWEQIEAVLAEHDPPKATGRKRIDQRKALNGIIFRVRSGCQWNHLPREFGDDSSVHRTFQRWVSMGILERIWAQLTEQCGELGGVDWQWQAADTALGKARLGGTRSVRTRRIEPRRAQSIAC
jgi:putative transposase